MSVLEAFIKNFRIGYAKGKNVDVKPMSLDEYVTGALDLIDCPASISVYVQGKRSEYGHHISRESQVASIAATAKGMTVVVEIYSYKFPRERAVMVADLMAHTIASAEAAKNM